MTSEIKDVWIGPALLARSNIKHLERTLAPGERVLAGTACNHTGGPGAVAVTNRRVCLISSISTRESVVDFPLDQVTSVAASGGLWGGKLTITAADRTETAKMAFKDAEKLAGAFREAKTAAQGQGAPVGGSSSADELAKYHGLLQAGAISQAEFDAKKAELL